MGGAAGPAPAGGVRGWRGGLKPASRRACRGAVLLLLAHAPDLTGHLYLAPHSGTGGLSYIQVRVPAPTAGTNLGLRFRTTGAGALLDALTLNADGTATFGYAATGPAFTATSDVRFKQHVRPLVGALAAVQQLRGVRYEWNALGVQHGGTAGAGQVGFIAQELERVYPELVLTDSEGYKSVNYAQLTPVLLEALKEQQQQIEALKAEAAGAKAEAAAASAALATFEARLRALEAGGEQARR